LTKPDKRGRGGSKKNLKGRLRSWEKECLIFIRLEDMKVSQRGGEIPPDHFKARGVDSEGKEKIN